MWRLHCDLEGCDASRKASRPAVIPDPWVLVEGDRLPGTEKLGFCCLEHAAEGLAALAAKGSG